MNLSETVAKPVRKFVFDYFLENSRAPVLEEIMRTFHLVRSEARDVLEELEAAHHVIRLPGTQTFLKIGGYFKTDFIYDGKPAGDPERFIPSSIPLGQPGARA